MLSEELEALRRRVAATVEVVPDRAEAADVDGWLAGFRALEGAVAALRTRLVGCVQASQAHNPGGHANTRAYIKEALGVSGREAARQDELARDLRQLPGTQAALAAGEIGPEQAQAIGRSARGGALGNPRATEEQLLPEARGAGAEELSRAIRRREQEADRASLERAERRAHRRRRASLARRGDGMWDLQALLPDEHGEALATALDAFRTFDPPGTPPPEERSPQQRTADAFTDLVAAVLRHGSAPTSGGVLPQLNIVVPLEAIDPGGAASGELAHGGVVSPAAIERLLCDANLRRLVTRGDSEMLDVGRSRRVWSVAQRHALRVRDGGCRGPGCDRPPAWTHAHHLLPWEDDGPTSVDNGILLCSYHHHQVHEGGWSVTLDLATAEATFRSPRDRTVVTRPHRPAGPRSTRPHRPAELPATCPHTLAEPRPAHLDAATVAGPAKAIGGIQPHLDIEVVAAGEEGVAKGGVSAFARPVVTIRVTAAVLGRDTAADGGETDPPPPCPGGITSTSCSRSMSSGAVPRLWSISRAAHAGVPPDVRPRARSRGPPDGAVMWSRPSRARLSRRFVRLKPDVTGGCVHRRPYS